MQWEAPRVICVAESYNRYDTDTADLLPVKIELLRYQLFENGMLTLDTESYQKVKIAGMPKLAKWGEMVLQFRIPGIPVPQTPIWQNSIPRARRVFSLSSRRSLSRSTLLRVGRLYGRSSTTSGSASLVSTRRCSWSRRSYT